MGSSTDKFDEKKQGPAADSAGKDKPAAKDPEANKDDVVPTTSHVVLLGGKEKTTFGLDEKKRAELRIPTVLSFLQRNKMNPIAEEGKYESPTSRERKGEYFITPEAFALLLYRDKQKYAARENKDAFNLENIIEIDNNPEKFCELLLKLNLKNGEDVKVTFIENVHAVPVYIRNENGRIRCYVADTIGPTTPNAQNIVRYLKGCLDNPDITIGPLIQEDWYSCFTFAKKFNMYAIKHGAELFPHIDRVGTTIDPITGCKLLSAEDLMPALLKLCQTNPTLTDEVLTTIVSQKQEAMLLEYLSKYNKESGDKVYNTAAVLKKSKYLQELGQTLSQLGVEEVNPDERVPLPKPIVDAIKDYYTAPKETYFASVCAEIVDFISQERERKDAAMSPLATAYLNHITKKFPDFKAWCKECFARFEMEDMAKAADDNFNFTGNLQRLLLINYAASYYFNDKEKLMNHVIEATDRLMQVYGDQDTTIANLKKTSMLTPERLDQTLVKIFQEFEASQQSLQRPSLNPPPGLI